MARPAPCLVCADATDNHTNIINFSTPPTWLYQTPDRVAFPDDPLGETWGYEQGNALRDASGKTFGELRMPCEPLLLL